MDAFPSGEPTGDEVRLASGRRRAEDESGETKLPATAFSPVK